MDAPSLQVVKAWLDGALEQSDLREGVSVLDREVEIRWFQSNFQSKPFYDNVT